MFNFRIRDFKAVCIGTKYAPFGDKDGKLYGSREKLYVQQNAFMVPKSSPLNASKICGLELCKFKSNIISGDI